jgi:tetratricopeptide (TPR) repeat protein
LHQADRYRELACDAWVTELVPDQAPTYAHALVDRLDRERVGLPVLAMVGTRRQHVARMKERLTLLFERPAIRAPRFALGLAVAVVVASLLMPHGSATTRERPVQEPAIAEVRSPLLDTYGVASFEELEQRSGQAIEADSSNGAAWSQLGVALLMTQKIPAAMEAFERQFELGFAPTIASYNLACCYALEIEPEEALYWLQQAVQSGFDDADHIESDPDLGILQELPEFHELLVALRGGGPQVSANQ